MGEAERVVQFRASERGLNPAEMQPESERAWLPLSEVTQKLGIPLSSLRRYLDRHGRYLPTMKTGKKVVIARAALPVVEHIRMLYDIGRTVAAVEDDLAATAFSLTRGNAAEAPARGAEATRPISPASRPQPGGSSSDTPLAVSTRTEGMPLDVAGQPLADMQRQIAALGQKLADMEAAVENRDLMIRQILAAVVHVVEAQDNERRFAETERQIADNERDRQTAHRHQQVMLSLQELLGHNRRRRWLW